MKLILAIFLISTVLCNEMLSLIDMSNDKSTHMELSYEMELDKESKEGIEDFSKVKIRQKINSGVESEILNDRELFSIRFITRPFLEIHSPPPDLF